MSRGEAVQDKEEGHCNKAFSQTFFSESKQRHRFKTEKTIDLIEP